MNLIFDSLYQWEQIRVKEKDFIFGMINDVNDVCR